MDLNQIFQTPIGSLSSLSIILRFYKISVKQIKHNKSLNQVKQTNLKNPPLNLQLPRRTIKPSNPFFLN